MVKKIRALVTGGAGFIGSFVADLLVNKGCEVYSVDDMSGGFWRNINSKCIFEKINLVDKVKAAKFIEKIRPELVYHLAADATEGRSQFTPINCTERNYLAFLYTLVPAIRAGNLKRFVAVSSMSVYGAQTPPFTEDMKPLPEDIYGISKVAMEEALKILAEVHHFEYAVVRPHNVYGPRQNIADPYRNVIGIFINQILNKKKYYIYGDGGQKRSFSYIDDVAPYIVKAGTIDCCSGQIFNVGPTEEFTINHMSDLILKEFFGDKNRVSEDLRPIYLPDRPKEVRNAYSSNYKITKLLGYKTSVSFEEGIKRMIKWAKELGPQQPRYMQELELVTESTPRTWKDKLL